MFGAEHGVVVEGYDAGGGVEMEGGDDEVGEADVRGGFGEEGEGGDEGAAVVVGLVVEDYTRFVGWLGGAGRGRHGLEVVGRAGEEGSLLGEGWHFVGGG